MRTPEVSKWIQTAEVFPCPWNEKEIGEALKGLASYAASLEQDQAQFGLAMHSEIDRLLAEIARKDRALRMIRDHIPHPSYCDPIHEACDAALSPLPSRSCLKCGEPDSSHDWGCTPSKSSGEKP